MRSRRPPLCGSWAIVLTHVRGPPGEQMSLGPDRSAPENQASRWTTATPPSSASTHTGSIAA